MQYDRFKNYNCFVFFVFLGGPYCASVYLFVYLLFKLFTVAYK